MITFIVEHRRLVLVLIGAFTLLFGIGTLLQLVQQKPQASMDPGGEVFELQERVDTLFPQPVHPVPFQIFPKKGKEVLTKEILLEVQERSQALRESQLGKEFLTGESFGFLTIADAVQEALTLQGSSLEKAPEQQVQTAVMKVLEGEHGEFFQSRLSQLAQKTQTHWTSPAFYFFVFADNEKLGGGVFRRTVGGDETTLEKERFNRQLKEALKGGSYTIYGMGMDLNLEATDQGFSLPVLLRMGGLVVVLSVLGGFALHSRKAALVVFLGLVSLFLWIKGLPFFTAGLLKPSLTIDVILPLAFLALGIDLVIHLGRAYQEELGQGKPKVLALKASATLLAPALMLATVTDGIAFGANMASPVEAVVAFGAVGLFAAFASLVVMGVGVPLLLLDIGGEHPNHQIPSQRFSAITGWILKRRAMVGTGFLLLVAGATGLLFQVDTRLDPRDFISKDSDFVKGLDLRDVHWGTTRGEEANIFVEGNLQAPSVRAALAKVRESLHHNPFLAHTLQGELVLPYGDFPLSVTEQGFATQIIVEVVNTRALESVRAARTQLEQDLAPLEGLAEWGLTGSPFTREASLDAVTSALVRTLGVAAGVILLLFLITFRSLRLALFALCPMVLVLLLVYGLMGAVGFGLNFITATIAAVSLGTGSDYAVYYIQRYRLERDRRSGAHEALRETAARTGYGIFLAALTSALGFAVLATAPMPLFATYGMLAVAMIGFSLATTVILLPILLSWERR